VKYTISRAGQPVSVIVSYPTWTQVGTEMFPSSITPTENGQLVFSIAVSTATAGAGNASDATFTIPITH